MAHARAAETGDLLCVEAIQERRVAADHTDQKDTLVERFEANILVSQFVGAIEQAQQPISGKAVGENIQQDALASAARQLDSALKRLLLGLARKAPFQYRADIGA